MGNDRERLTAEQYRAMAAERRVKSLESFERCDTDGFLSQWALDVCASQYDMMAELVENDCKSCFWGLYEGERRVMAKTIQVRSNYSYRLETVWVLHDSEAEKFGRKFIPYGSKSRIQTKLGLKQLQEVDDAWITLSGDRVSCRPVHYRTGDEWGKTAKLLED